MTVSCNCGVQVIPSVGVRTLTAGTGKLHWCDYAALLAHVPRTIQCICGVIVKEHQNGYRNDAGTGKKHRHARKRKLRARVIRSGVSTGSEGIGFRERVWDH